ncbi:MAG: hypothetical protein IT458_08745 [Planctomycetes bacterium]|nr:hypothetical protein [Planctomycetota bacterium]
MLIHFQCLDLSQKAELASHFERRAAFALDRFRPRIRHLRLRVWDDNGPKGGIDKRCHLAVELDRGPHLHFDDADRDARLVIDRVLDRAARGLARLAERWKTFGDRIPAGGAAS